MSQKHRIVTYALAYGLWVVSTLLALLVLNILRDTIVKAMVVSVAESGQREQFYQGLRYQAVSQWSVLVIGLIMVILLLVFEHLYREGVQTGSLLKRFFLVTAIESGVLFVVHTISFLLQSIGWLGIVIPIVEALVAAAFFWLWNNQKKLAAQAVRQP